MLTPLEGHSNRVTSVSVTADGPQCVSTSYDCTLRIWDMEAGTCLHSWKGILTGSISYR